jgi:hypothetical protein
MFTFRPSDDLPGLTWCLRFPQVSFPEWKDRFTIHLWEGKNRCSYAKAKKDEQRYIQEALEDVEMIDPDEDGETGHQSDSEDEDPSEAESEGDSRDETEDTLSDLDPKTKNQQLAVGYKNDLSYVTRGSQIGVFAHTNDRFAHRATIESIKDIEGRSFTPKQVCFPLVRAERRSCSIIKTAICYCSTLLTAIRCFVWIWNMERSWMNGKSLIIYRWITFCRSEFVRTER